jgi:LuxR family maltose regulon positive regulatory protein
MENLKFFWLGIPVIECNSAILQLETRKSIALLAYLSLSDTPFPRENLATLFWPEFDQTHALANLRRNLFSLKNILGSEIILSDRDQISLNPDYPIWQDVGEFHQLLNSEKSHQHGDKELCPECVEKLEKANALYRGDFLQGINLNDSPDFDDWQFLQREDFRVGYCSALEKLAYAYTNGKEWKKAIQTARKLINSDRLSERFQRILLETLARSGERNSAIHHYEEFVRFLREEIDQKPEVETRTLVERIQAGEFGASENTSSELSATNSTHSNNEPLIRQKLFIPHRRSNTVSRPNLMERLEKSITYALTLVSAPAGYGKTTLLAEWIETCRKSQPPVSVCWLSLDSNDNDPIRFLTYLTAALEPIHPKKKFENQPFLQSSSALRPTSYLSSLINEVQDISNHVILVLDDYHLINNPIIHDGISFILEHIPENFHIVISTRSDPSFPLALLRGRNQLNEIRARDLRFSSEEVTSLLLKVFDLPLTSDQITILENRTEGWIAGLQMAALSLTGRTDIAEYLNDFSGTHRFIIDYLTEEALVRQSKDVQNFLLRTSILERMNGPLCDFILDNSAFQDTNGGSDPDSIDRGQEDSKTILQNLDHSNLFVVPLDDERVWYRYHHLFKDLLHSRLEHTSPHLLPTLHIRASGWFEANGWTEESITHALEAKNWECVNRLIDLNFRKYLENGQMATVLEWIRKIPHDIVMQYPKLCAQVAETFSQAGMISQIDPFLDRAEVFLSPNKNQQDIEENSPSFNLSPAERIEILSMIAILRGLKSICLGDPQKAIFWTHSALANYPEMKARELAVLFWVEGWAQRSLGNLSQALESLTKGTEFAQKSGAIMRDIWTDLGNVTRLAGKLTEAEKIITSSLRSALARGIQNQGNLSRDETFLSFIMIEQNQLELASMHASQALEHTRWWPSHVIIAMANLSLAQIHLINDELDESLSALGKADKERTNWLMTPFVQSLAEVTWARLWLKQNNWDQLDKWVDEQLTMFDKSREEGDPVNEYLETRLIMVVRILLIKTKINMNHDRYKVCSQILEWVEESSRKSGRLNSLVEVLLLEAVDKFSQGKNIKATVMEECLEIAESGGYMRVFLDTGEMAHSLISTYLIKNETTHRSYALKILKAFGGFIQKSDPVNDLIETITSREMDVLHLLAEGHSNIQMAEKLFVSEGTIKFHVHQLLTKLQVKSRTQAIIKAKELEII